MTQEIQDKALTFRLIDCKPKHVKMLQESEEQSRGIVEHSQLLRWECSGLFFEVQC